MSILPEEMWVKIFNLCDVYTLLQLNSVCKQFHRVSNEILTKKSKRLLITNEISKKFCERCKPLLSSYNSKFITYYNWKYGIYKRNVKCERSFELCKGSRHSINIRRLDAKMTRNTVWFFDYTVLYACNRTEDGNIKEKIAVLNCSSSITCIAYSNDMIISGHLDGGIRHWRIESRNNNIYLQQLKIHCNVYNSHVSSIEVTTQHIISSSENLIKIQKNILEEDSSAEKNETIYSGKELIRSISLDPIETKLAACTEESLLIYDISKNCQIIKKCIKHEIGQDYVIASACIKLLWQDPHTILMLYEHRIAKMDTRIMEFVCTWDSSFPEEYYIFSSFSSDNLYTILTGTIFGDVILWDQRLSKRVQEYDLCPNKLSACVISVQFDSTHMYTVTECEGLIECDFKKFEGNHLDRAKRKEYFSNFK